jgi:hypothetical protein
VSLSEDETLALAKAESAESQMRAREVRAFLLGLLHESEPPADSAAHLRWELDASILALQQDEDYEEVRRVATALRHLASTPIAAEVLAATNRSRLRMPSPRPRGVSSACQHAARTLLSASQLHFVPLVAAVAGGLTIAFGFTNITPRANFVDAYELRYEARQTSAGELVVRNAAVQD